VILFDLLQQIGSLAETTGVEQEALGLAISSTIRPAAAVCT